MRRILTAVFAALLTFPTSALTQSFTGTITGTIKDVSGAMIPRAIVSCRNRVRNACDGLRSWSRVA